MMDSHKETPITLFEEACEWLLELQSSDGNSEALKQRFMVWLRRSPAHVEEFLQAAALRVDLESLPRYSEAELAALVTEAGSNVVAMAETPVEDDASDRRKVRRRAWWPGAAAAAVLMLAVGVYFWGRGNFGLEPEAEIYRTALGEQRSVLLDDGSLLQLNTRSQIEVTMTSRRREMHLISGEVLFAVTRDSKRPFRVVIGDTRVDVLGTRFNVYRQRDKTLVTVADGRVALAAAGRHAVELGRGERASVVAGHELKVESGIDINKALAWTDRQLIFEDAALSDVIEEVNRYNRRQLFLLDQSLAGKHINGRFDTNRPEVLVAFLNTSDELVVVQSPDEKHWLIKSRMSVEEK